MGVPCVRVPREEGEATRERLAERGVLSDTHEIAVEDGDKIGRASCRERV